MTIAEIIRLIEAHGDVVLQVEELDEDCAPILSEVKMVRVETSKDGSVRVVLVA